MATNQCDGCGSFLESWARTCPRCGRQAHERSSGRKPGAKRKWRRLKWVVLGAGLCAVGWAAISFFKKTDRKPVVTDTAPPAEAQATLEIWPVLQEKYPDLRTHWQDYSGVTVVGIPQFFWNAMLLSEKKRLARELDALFPSRNWTVVTGRYWGGPLIRMEYRYLRQAFFEDEDESTAPPDQVAVVQAQPRVTPQAALRRPPGPVQTSGPDAAPRSGTKPPSLQPPAMASRNASADSTLPDYEVLYAIDAFRSDRRYGEILVPALSPGTPTDERRRIAKVIAQRENLDDLTLYCTREAREAHYSMDYADQHPQALDGGLLGALERGRFVSHKPRSR